MCLVAAALVGLGAYAGFTATANASQQLGSGTLELTLGENSTLSLGAGDLAPGDTVQRAVDLVHGGTVALAGITLDTAATTSSALDTDAAEGLQVRVDVCSQPWDETGAGGVFTYACAGDQQVALAEAPIVGSGRALANVNLDAGATTHLRVTVSLPSEAGNDKQGLTSTIEYTFTAVQREVTSR